MKPDIIYILAMSCVLPAIAGLARYNQMEKKYHPFVFLMLLDVAIETVYKLHYNPALTFNIYLIISFGLFLYFVFINHFISKKIMLVFEAAAIVVAGINFFGYKTICAPFLNDSTNLALLRSSYLLCFISIAMLFICIDIFARQITEIKVKLVNNCWFWICSFYILSVSYNLLIFCPYIFAMSNLPDAKAIGNIHHCINMVCYLFSIVGILKIPGNKTAGYAV